MALDEAADEGGGDQADKKVADDEGHGNQTEVEAVEDDRCGDQAEAAEEEENRNQPEEETKRQRTECELFQRKSEEINLLLQENRELRCELNKSKADEDFLKGNTDKVRYYTGILCFAILMSLFNSVKDFPQVSKKLSPFQMVLLTLMSEA